MPKRPGCVRAALISIAISILCVPGILALPGTVGPLEQVSGESPFDGCTADNPGSQSGIFAGGSEVEPWIGVNPTDPLNMVATWQQDRWTNGGSRGLVVGVTHDGGLTWKMVPVPGLSRCSGGTFLRASDPWLSFAPNGDLHHISLSFSPGQTNAMLVNRSTDGGLTWSDPIRLIVDSGRFFNDKETITADPTNRLFVYAVWDRLDFFANRGPAVYSRSTNGGRSWTQVRILYDPGPGGQTIGNQIVVLPNGTILNFFNEILFGERILGFKRSLDKGAVWKPKLGREFVSRMQQRSAAVPGSHALVRDGAILFDVAVDRRRGTLYAVWQESSFSNAGHPSIAFTMSRDNGEIWSKPVKVNRTPKSPGRSFREQAFTASVHVADNGLVGVSYYDFRNDTDDPSGLTDSWLVWCHPFASDCRRSARWKDEARLTDESFDITRAPFAGGLFLGDYVGLSAVGNDFVALFTQPHDDDRASAFMRRVVVEERVEPRSAGFWKHQLRVALTGRGRGHLDESELTAALQDIKALYNVLDHVKKLDDLLALLMPEGAFDLRGQTVRQLTALLLNLTTERLPPFFDVGDGRSVIDSIGMIIDVLEDPEATHTDLEGAKNLAEAINQGEFPVEVSSGALPRGGGAVRTLLQDETPVAEDDGGRQVTKVKQVVID